MGISGNRDSVSGGENELKLENSVWIDLAFSLELNIKSYINHVFSNYFGMITK